PSGSSQKPDAAISASSWSICVLRVSTLRTLRKSARRWENSLSCAACSSYMYGSSFLSDRGDRDVVQDGRGKQEPVATVQYAAVAGKEHARVFHARVPFERGFDEIAEL